MSPFILDNLKIAANHMNSINSGSKQKMESLFFITLQTFALIKINMHFNTLSSSIS